MMFSDPVCQKIGMESLLLEAWNTRLVFRYTGGHFVLLLSVSILLLVAR